jgi:hypothetical protein
VQSLYGIEISQAVQYLIAFVIIFVLLALFAVVLRRITAPRIRTPNQAGRNRQPRLGVIDSFDIDRRRQLVLVRRDNVEHLIMIGGPTDVVVESNIVRAVQRQATPASPPATLAEALAQMPSQPAPAAAEPVLPLRPTVVEPRQETRPEMRPDPKPENRVPEGRTAERKSPFTPLPSGRAAAPADPSLPVGESPGREKAPVRDLGRALGGERTASMATTAAGLTQRPPLPQPPRTVEPPSETRQGAAPSGEPSPSEADTLAAMSRHLGEVLQRPFAAPPAADVVAAPAERPAPVPRPRASSPLPFRDRSLNDQGPYTDRPAVPMPDRAQPTPEPSRSPEATAPFKNGSHPPEPVAVEPSATPAKAIDPFSVDDIEAEFARLLGRVPPRSS